jgi:hypothetical protein
MIARMRRWWLCSSVDPAFSLSAILRTFIHGQCHSWRPTTLTLNENQPCLLKPLETTPNGSMSYAEPGAPFVFHRDSAGPL